MKERVGLGVVGWDCREQRRGSEGGVSEQTRSEHMLPWFLPGERGLRDPQYQRQLCFTRFCPSSISPRVGVSHCSGLTGNLPNFAKKCCFAREKGRRPSLASCRLQRDNKQQQRRGNFAFGAWKQMRSSAQGNCSAKSFAGNVADSSSSSLSSMGGGVQGQGGLGAGGLGRGRGLGGRGQGTFHPPCYVLHYHMVLRP